jgi:hypothetical protein
MTFRFRALVAPMLEMLIHVGAQFGGFFLSFYSLIKEIFYFFLMRSLYKTIFDVFKTSSLKIMILFKILPSLFVNHPCLSP